MVGGSLVPFARLGDALWHVNANLMVVSHRKFAGWKLLRGCLLRIFESQLLVLLEDPLVAKEKPTADTERGFGVALISSKAIVV